MALSVVVGITLGIVVDDTIYVMSTYMQARRVQGLPPEEAIRYTFAHVGTAVWFASLTLIAGFAVLIFSDFLGKYEQYLGRYWRPGEMVMQNHQSGKSTLLTFTNYRLRTGLRDSDFHPNVLEQAR